MADDDSSLLKEDGYLNIDAECRSIIYHPNLNVLLITTSNAQVYVFDVNFGVILQRSIISDKADGKLLGVYLADGVDKILYTNGKGIGVRSDYNGVLLLDTILQTPVSRSEDIIKLELLLSEACLLHQCLRLVDLPGVDHVHSVLQELWNKILVAQETQKKGIKAQKWNIICLELPHGVLKLVCSGLVTELKKQNKHIPALPIASAINERLNGLLPGFISENGPADKAPMFSEAARRETFLKWPHMNYKWALPGQMAQAGFYYEPNATAEDRAMCFTCNVCLVCWEPTDEPWSEHERHSPTCPFVRGEYTQNVPLSVTLATAPACESNVEIISTTNVPGLIATASHSGFVHIWDINSQLKSETSFYIRSCNQDTNNADSLQFYATKNLSNTYLSNLNSEGESLGDFKSANFHKAHLTALSIIGGPLNVDESKFKSDSTNSATIPECTDMNIRSCLVCGISVMNSVNSSSHLRTLENVWASTDMATSSSLVRAMNSVNSAASDSLDIMKIASDNHESAKSHYIVLYDFHHKVATSKVNKENVEKHLKIKKTPSGTGTSSSSTSGRQDSLYQELCMSKLLYEVPVIEEVDSDMIVGAHFDGIFSNKDGSLNASSSNTLYPASLGLYVQPSTTSSTPYDANFNPINEPDQLASTSDVSEIHKKVLDVTKNVKSDPIVLQSFVIDADPSLRITFVGPTKDGKHLYVALTCQSTEHTTSDSPSNTNKMDVDEESEIFSSKSYMYWDQNDDSSENKTINSENHNFVDSAKALLLVYALDFSEKVPKIITEPVVKRELSANQTPITHVFLPLQEKYKSYSSSKSNININEPRGQVALVCKDGVVRILNLATLKIVSESRPEGEKFISATYCSRLERLCVCTSNGTLRFFITADEDDSLEGKDDIDDINMIVTESAVLNHEQTAPSTSTSSTIYQELIIAHRPNLTCSDLRSLYDLTRFDRQSPAYSATIPSCWSEMMQAQRQRRYPQHLHQSENQHHTRTWRLQNDSTTWDEHIFEITLPRKVVGNIGHIDVRFNLHSPCLEPPNIQVTLLKQNITGLGHQKSHLTPVDEKIQFNLNNEQKGENPIISEEFQRQHNTEILCGPINLKHCMDLSDHSGCITLTSPKLFRTKARTLLVHIKALIDPAKDGGTSTSKSRVNLLDNKPPTTKKQRIDDAGPFFPGTNVERFAANAHKKLEYYIGCDWIHEISITVRTVQPTSIPNERTQRWAMLDSSLFTENLVNIACLQGADKSLIMQSLALDILIWVTSIRLLRLRVGQNVAETKAFQLDTIRCIQVHLPELLRTCLFHAGRSITHKCVKLIIICSEGLKNLDDNTLNSFDEAVLSVLITLLPSIISIRWAGSLRWLTVLINRLLPLDQNHNVAQQCIIILQRIAGEMSNRVNPYHLLLATRFGLYNNPFETKLFDIETPMLLKSNSLPLTYASVVTGEQTSSTISSGDMYSQDHIDLRDLLTLPIHSNSELVVPNKLKSLYTNHSTKGLLEAEPLHFTCHSVSDGTKMEKMDLVGNTVNFTSLYDNVTNNGVPDLKTVQPSYSLEAESLGSNLKTTCEQNLKALLTHCKAEMNKNPTTQLSIISDDQSDSDEVNMTRDDQKWHVNQTDSSNLKNLTSSIIKEKSFALNNNSTVSNVDDNHIKKREEINFPWARLLSLPSQQALVVERMHSGARRFIVLDFGSPVLLTDLMIPSCSDLVSLSIDIWTKSEEKDGIRLVVAGDIGTKPLIVNDLQPPPVCRFLKITTIGRYGMTTTRCKIPLGMFYGHIVVLPGEDYSDMFHAQSNDINRNDTNLIATIDSQCNILSTLAEDIQCRFSLATEKLKALLDPLLCTETPNVVHMQHYLSRGKNLTENKEQPSSKILSTYQECIAFQHQLNIIRGVWCRLESWKGAEMPLTTQLSSVPSDKLRILGETLSDILLYTIHEIEPIPTVPSSICEIFTPSICERFFHSICVVTPAPRLQLHAVALLVRMAGHQPWWGNFLSNTLINLYSSSSTDIFPQDRVFILLTFLGRKSLNSGANKSSVIDAMVRTLGRFLIPMSDYQPSNAAQLDISLIGWILLFLSVCLDTATTYYTYSDENGKSKEHGISSRWEFLQGELAMQRKYVNASRTNASRNYRKKLQKRLMHHKQQLHDGDPGKKYIHVSTSQGLVWSSGPPISTLSNKLEVLKSHEKHLKKTLKQHSAFRHFRDMMKRNDLHHVPRSSRNANASNSKSDILDADVDNLLNLSYQSVLPVVRGLVALILHNTANIDMFLLSCKIIAKLVISTRPIISLNDLMTEDQLSKLIKLSMSKSDAAWMSHAVTCLLQDLFESGRLFSKPFSMQDNIQTEENFDAAESEEEQGGDDDLAGTARTGGSGTTVGNDEGFAEGEVDEDTQDSIPTIPPTPSTSKSNGFDLPSLLESDDSELEDFLDDILEKGRNMLKKGNSIPKIPQSASSGISSALDARLEYGVEMGVEIALRRYSTLGAYNLPRSINAPIQVQVETNRSKQFLLRNIGSTDRNHDMRTSTDSIPSSLSMLMRCFDKIFTDMSFQNSGINLELILQLWLTLNLDASKTPSANTSNQFDPSLVPVIPLSSTAISGLISTLLWHPGISLRAWCLALQTLTLASNEPMPSDHSDPSINTPLDGLLGGMACCIVKNRNIGPVLLRLLSGNGLNIEPHDKQCMIAGPKIGEALQDFLLRLEMRCDVITPGSVLGNALKELLLWVVYELIQPGGVIVARRGPLDAQCILITSLINLNFMNTDLGTAMSITECVGVLVSTYVQTSRIGAQCSGAVDLTNQSGGFGGLFSGVLGATSKQGRPASWDALIVALVKLVCKLVQTPLPNLRLSRVENPMNMEIGDINQKSDARNIDQCEKLNSSQTDESKVAEQQTSIKSNQSITSKRRHPCVADTVLQHEPTMIRLLGALGHSTGSSLAMLFGEDSTSSTVPELGDPNSIPDATFQLLMTLVKKATNPTFVLNPLYHYLSSSQEQINTVHNFGVMQLSEPLLWYILKVLDNETSLVIFTELGGVKIICENMVKSSSTNYGYENTNILTPGIIALVMQHLSNVPNLAIATGTSSKKSTSNLESHEEGLLNFAPLGTISWLKPMVEPADVLIQSAAPHRRARTAAWSYHFFPGEAWIDLTITLPCAILLKEVELQPHLTALVTCPSAVALEISREANSDFTPICPPMLTAGLTFIRLTLAQPQVTSAVLVRLYKPRDSTNISLSQIRILGTTAFGDIKSRNETIDEEKLTKMSLGWLRLIYQCFSVSALSSTLSQSVLDSAASVTGLIEACCTLLLLPAPSLFTSNLERVLLQLGLHSRELGLQLISLLLNNRCTLLFQKSLSSQKTSIIQLIIELLQQLCNSQDANTEARIIAVLTWLHTSSMNSITQDTHNNPNVINPPAAYIHCISTIIWEAQQIENRTYNLESMLTDDLFDSLYQWTLLLQPNSALKQSIDATLCAFCYVRPSLFTILLQKVRILVPNLATDQFASVSDDRKESDGQTDDKKSEANTEEWYCRLHISECKHLELTEGQLLTVATAARSTPGIQQLIDSGLPSLLVNTIVAFCKIHMKIIKEQNSTLDVNKCHSRSNVNSGLTDNDKAGETVYQTQNISGLNMYNPDSIATVIEFLTLVCSEGKMRDWLGEEGRIFWLPLVTLLNSKPVESPSTSFAEVNVSYTKLENATIKFLSKCCWCHPHNQKLLAELLTDVISQERVSPFNMKYLLGISGFTRRLILQLLLEEEKVLVSVVSDVPMSNNASNQAIRSMFPHPAHPLGHYHQLLYISTQSTMADILQQVSGSWLTLLLPNNFKENETITTGTNCSRELWESSLVSVVDKLSVAAGNTAKDKQAKEASNKSQARGPTIRKSRVDSDVTSSSSSSSKSTTTSTQDSSINSLTQQYLSHSARPNVILPSSLSIAQLLAIAEDNGLSLSSPYLHLVLHQRNKDNKDDSIKLDDSDLLTYRCIESALSVFSATGGLAVLAKHLPLIYPDSSQPRAFIEKTSLPEQTETEWVKVETNEDVYEDLEDGGNLHSSRATSSVPHVPLHSLTAFGLFLRLPGYAEVLLKNRKQAQCLLRLALGVVDDGEGGDVFNSQIASSLPTLPFQVLKQLLKATPLTTDDGLLLRRTMVDIGAILLLLNCLAIFTHQTGYNELSDQKNSQTSSRSDDKSHLYWAKGTGFGTGSTQQSWNVEQALLRQRSEEEHVTILLRVLASYVGSGSHPQRELPATFAELISRSCLLPALSSYLRNDSVLDMARHIPLYRAVLQLLRSMALSPQLALLLLPRIGKSNDPSIVSLLSTMRICVDTYVHKINRSRSNKLKGIIKYPDDTEQDEGLATLIPDIQESATLVQNATSRLPVIGEELVSPSPTATELPLKSIEQRYLDVMKNLQFDTYEMISENSDGSGYRFAVSYHFESNMRAAGDRSHPIRVKRLAQEAVTLSTALPLSYSSSVFVRCDTDRLDIMKVLITGPAETPYANGCFEFDVYFPPEYPNSPMLINLETTGRHTVRFNPNLYNDGKVCLSVLNTWHGRPEEKWNAHTSSFLQVLVSIQSLILVPEPYFNEPGYERSRGTASGAQSSQEYNANICLATVKWAMLDQIKNPCPCFKDVIHTHFWIKRHEIVAQLESWIMDMETYGSDKRSARTISLNALALKRHYRLLRDALNKLPTPQGLEDLVEPLQSPSSPLEMSGTPNTPPTSTLSTVTIATPVTNVGGSNHIHHEIDTDVEMEKMVSNVCE
ncbi:baculoviral IAP repeat-containing protein 6 isoform X2 [Cotesia glomerata]|uniref:baculoviral IAP repeat-containing protein 6 isoform X2 n=1 Tax=Cotesia glomerata TaxID=32391 RepID=UPI001D01E4A3|nr:baculoviral IAP repeat-containing protein 6 isoform X2 [Cotesia glomerata]